VFTVEQRDALCARVLRLAEEDERVVAGAAVGSLAVDAESAVVAWLPELQSVPMTSRRAVSAGIACSVALAGSSSVPADAALHACKPVLDPYPGTRYDDVDLTRIRASGSCVNARRVARKAHRKALRLTPTRTFRRFTWNGWAVTGDLRPDHDRYVARKNGRQVRWRF